MPNPAPVVRVYHNNGIDKLSCSATGTLPIHIAMIRNTTVLANTTSNVVIGLYKEGSYTCVATNKYGTDTRVIPVVILGKRFLWRT